MLNVFLSLRLGDISFSRRQHITDYAVYLYVNITYAYYYQLRYNTTVLSQRYSMFNLYFKTLCSTIQFCETYTLILGCYKICQQTTTTLKCSLQYLADHSRYYCLSSSKEFNFYCLLIQYISTFSIPSVIYFTDDFMYFKLLFV